jgi:hypothetical protein
MDAIQRRRKLLLYYDNCKICYEICYLLLIVAFDCKNTHRIISQTFSIIVGCSCWSLPCDGERCSWSTSPGFKPIIHRLTSPTHRNKFFLWFLTITITAGIIACVVLSGVYLIQANSPYIWYQPLDGIPMLNTLKQLCGCLLVSVYAVLSIAAICAVVGSLGRNRADVLQSVTDTVQPNNKFAAKLNLVNYGVLLCSFSFIFLLSPFYHTCGP